MVSRSIKTFTVIFVVVSTLYIYTTHFVNKKIDESLSTDLSEYYKRQVTYTKFLTSSTKVILLWTSQDLSPFYMIEKGQKSFLDNRCPISNCFITDDRSLFNEVTQYDAIAFNGHVVAEMSPQEMPNKRSPRQKYIFADMESSDNYPVCKPFFDGYFNWTYTYKLNSDARWGYVTIYDINGTIAGPKTDMRWPDFKPIGDELKTKLRSKTKAAAWFVSNCRTRSKREDFAAKVSRELAAHNLSVDVYGLCGKLKCPRQKPSVCHRMLERDYYFYFAFENSFADDYVTEKVFTALNHLTVPVVYGAANYSRFLPPGSYLDARKLGPKKLAATMMEIIANETRYHEFFRWRNDYRYAVTSANTDLCNLCSLVNSDKAYEYSVYNNIREWWNPNYKNRCKTI